MAKKKEKYTAWQLDDSVLVKTEIDCTKCQTKNYVFTDAEDAIFLFFSDGWRSTPNHTYCPKCAKKYLKL